MLGIAVSTCYAVSSLAAQSAQDPRDAQVWDLQGLRAGYCVRFLLDPRRTPRTPKDVLPVRADQDQHLHPALRQAIASQPEFASWASSRLCFYYLDAIQMGDHREGDKKGRKPQLLAVWSLATAMAGAKEQRDFVADLYGGRGGLVRAAEGTKVSMEEVRAEVSDAADPLPNTYTVQIGKTLLVWTGRPVGDSTRVTQPIVESWSVIRLRNLGVWQAELAFAPEWSRPLVGSLRVEGKGDLAQALKASPIRFVGPLYRGGGGKLSFRR